MGWLTPVLLIQIHFIKNRIQNFAPQFGSGSERSEHSLLTIKLSILKKIKIDTDKNSCVKQFIHYKDIYEINSGYRYPVKSGIPITGGGMEEQAHRAPAQGEE